MYHRLVQGGAVEILCEAMGKLLWNLVGSDECHRKPAWDLSVHGAIRPSVFLSIFHHRDRIAASQAYVTRPPRTWQELCERSAEPQRVGGSEMTKKLLPLMLVLLLRKWLRLLLLLHLLLTLLLLVHMLLSLW